MATELSRGTLFDPTLVTDLISKVKGKSSLAVLSQQTPIPFNGLKEFIFSMDSEIDVVAENGKKTHGGIKLEPLKIVPIKVEYGARVSDEFLYASEEEKINIMRAFNDGFAKKLAKGIDMMAFHGINPRTGEASTVIGDNHFDSKATQKVVFNKAQVEENIEAAIAQVQGADREVTGMVISTEVSSALASLKVNGVRQYPELSFGANPGDLNGLKMDINKTIKSNLSNDVGIVGDFENMFKWGYSKQIPFEIIKYGDPDNSGKDLKGYNQVYLRAEAYVGWGIMDGESFARLTTA
ncbi:MULTISPECIES: phage major capsid protein [Clostridia]|jgi:HK97 family phage major capsid protein|uniref:phage major capsid family protein n=1 Tax=Clostridia TaxID=186801 RepID=UPI0003385913|nr:MULTISPECIES: phage major capsid protein [Clostridia]MBS5595815.1 phage major capsid protein [Peptostreptococcus sp.]MDK8278265.1 phage major capsid protein [Peptostreptococcus anaerobius]MDU1175687.1 phage major capsid protein [Peptostreptococcus anaerobius]MDU1232147.1 phage major capsid protein [Clostridium sp.]MDU1233604.1 phage major capsid protein [Peptostreptococcus anaerobius]